MNLTLTMPRLPGSASKPANICGGRQSGNAGAHPASVNKVVIKVEKNKSADVIKAQELKLSSDDQSGGVVVKCVIRKLFICRPDSWGIND